MFIAIRKLIYTFDNLGIYPTYILSDIFFQLIFDIFFYILDTTIAYSKSMILIYKLYHINFINFC